MQQKIHLHINKISLAAMFLALAWLFPFISGQIPEFGNMLLLMHIPAILAGFVLGPKYGLVLGFIMPLTRSMVFGMPPIYPVSLAMAFELATYGFVSGFLFRWLLKKKEMDIIINVYITLFVAMIAGRAVWGLVQSLIGVLGNLFTWEMFVSGAFLIAWPGIIIQFLLIPALVKVLYSSRVMDKFIT